MHSKTKKKIKLLQEFALKHHKDWFLKHPGNIVGVRIGKKIKDNNIKNYYSFIFHVVEKLNSVGLTESELIPEKINVAFSDGTHFVIKTDVEETGRFKFQYAICDQINNNTAGEAGTLGLFLTDGANAYALTNYHVAAWDLMQNNKFFYDVNSGDPQDNLTIGGNNVILSKGTITDKIDAAFLQVGAVGSVNNLLASGNKVDNKGFTNPSDLYIGETAYAYPPSMNTGYSVSVVTNSMPFDTGYKGITLTQTIAFLRYSDPGDSGSLILTDSFSVIGILVGADDKYSYIIPYSEIYAFNPLDII